MVQDIAGMNCSSYSQSNRIISLRELSRLTDIQHATLSELSNHKRENINFYHIEKIAEALGIHDIREIIDLIDK
ncbi:helix-turn-helix transcriptional regulator [Oceanobacillus sp. J11TS1]|uniref:helix-turn-helix domain-containing protein n=1 Tax=Oceanobacillus sp. J11TS1 TaxID=2807191 RepID=UPI001FD391B7|nr:helix-turn-helix transcriptional regulator [Oceanobacillus sp. J11TS1]